MANHNRMIVVLIFVHVSPLLIIFLIFATGNRNHHGVYWFMLKKGALQRCLCGCYFQLSEGPATKVY